MVALHFPLPYFPDTGNETGQGSDTPVSFPQKERKKMSEELSKAVSSLPADLLPDTMDFDRLISQGAFPRINVMQGLSQLVSAKKAQIGDLCVETGHNFGEELKALVCGWRPRAIVLSGAGVEAESFVPRSPTWKDIESQSRSRGGESDRRPQFGPEFLVWIPPTKCTVMRDAESGKGMEAHDEEFTGFVTFHFAKTMRRRADDVLACMNDEGDKKTPGWGYFSTEKVETQFTWYVANCKKLVKAPKEQPVVAELLEALTEFMKPVVEETKALHEAETGSDRVR